MQNLTYALLLILFAISFAHAQNNQYHEYADHPAISNTYYDIIPRGPESAYVVQTGGIVKIEGKTKTDIYVDPYWPCFDYKIFTSPEDTTIYMYNFFDYDIGISIITKVTINQDSVEVLNTVDNYFNGNYPSLRLYVEDMMVDSLGQTLVFSYDGLFALDENLDTTFVSNSTINYNSTLIKNATHDIFLIKDNLIAPLLPDYTFGQTKIIEKGVLEINFIDDNFYVLYADHIDMYGSEWQDTNMRIDLDPAFGIPKDFTFNENKDLIVLQGHNQIFAQTVKYDSQNNIPEVIYQETIGSLKYDKIKRMDRLIFSIGKHREVPVLGIQTDELTVNEQRLNMSIEDISITYTVDVEDDCNYSCEDYSYNISYTVKNNSQEPVSFFTIAAYEFPLQFGQFPTLFIGYNKDTLIAPGLTANFKGKYNTQWFYGTFPFEIMGNNFALDAKFDDSYIEFSDLILSTNDRIKPTLPFQVYPNPAQGTISLDSAEAIYKVDVYHINGRLIKSLQSQQVITQVDLPQLPDGLYTLRIWDKEFKKFGIQKVMIQH